MDVYPAAAKRVYFFDNLRAFIVLLVVVFHVAMGYTTWNLDWWPVNDILKNSFFDLFILATDVFIMPIMFLIAGYFAPPVLLKKGPHAFWRDKLRRIVLPWAFGVLLIASAISYVTISRHAGTPPDYFSFLANGFFGPYYQQAHFWFLGILAVFFLLFTIAAVCKPAYFDRPTAIGIPSAAFFPLFTLLSAVPFFGAYLFFGADEWVNVKFLFMIQPVRIGLYLCYFVLGVYAWKNAWFSGDGYRPSLLKWGTAAIVMLFVFMGYRVTFTLTANIPLIVKAGHALLFAVFCLVAVMAFIGLFERFADSDAYVWRRLAANSYAIYYIHQCVVIPLAYMVQKIQFDIWIKYLTVSACAVVLCFLIAEYFVSPVLSCESVRHQDHPDL
jgi:glucan biosynthesis protein C